MERKTKKERRRCKKEAEEVGFVDENIQILDIPIHILFDIMLKLPAVSLIRCSSVCYKFKSIIFDPSFQQSYLIKAPLSFVVLSDNLRLTSIDSQFHTLNPNISNHSSSCIAIQPSLDSKPCNPTSSTTSTASTAATPTIHHHHHHHHHQQQSRNNRTNRFVTFHIHRHVDLINSSNGLLCLRASNCRTPSRSLYYICNPLLGEALTVPLAPSPADQNLYFSAFGFDPKKKHFKILQLVFKSDQMVAELYQSDSGSRTWSLIPDAPSTRPMVNSSFDPSLNGALHWLTEDASICSFDLNNNKFKSVPPPSHFDDEYVSRISTISVGVLKGCLCLCYVIEGARLETWVMSKYGEKESWSKAFSIEIKSYCGLSPQDKHRPIGFNTSGEMWVTADSDSRSFTKCLVSFNPETGVFRNIEIGGAASNIQATPQVLSYFSIKKMVNIRHSKLQLQTLRSAKNHALGFDFLLMGNFR
ncbi:F-box/kelch-repeat protein At3g06240 [Medicago truncatula]|uniref:F-box protein interaction domain protein n=1 Tax=Medicago truncatula TaxID=3880 RepID=A0A072UTS1_MEDTR|nr:F-box/kelch-repeat protein At3g06240 [Medicago truncatula]KEH32741.1 F-box protein interaction domain protein [Medicago truncatula]